MFARRDVPALFASIDEPGMVNGSQAPRAETRRVPIGRAVGRLAVAAACLIVLGMAAGFLAFVHGLDRYESRPTVVTDGIVALTGGSQRIGDAADLLARGWGRRLLITGVNERTTREQIALANPDLRRLVDCCVDLDYRARNTLGNAIETRRWSLLHGFRSLTVVTSNYHMPRTLVELGHALPTIRLVPYAVVTEQTSTERWWRDFATARLLFLEYVKYVVAILRTRFEGDPEHSRFAAFATRAHSLK
ncbi:YdcF family protein [Chelatococcus sp. SYSU_G07232]|uniref:YdcF family protein n=1 Tax=Chelatococcus albus TaxID=3047466 RepID=A0ABT7AEL0_9HYPH|nr:YdcF family protein [Chelatococcus sp. SYSU_G07232]MDJ1157432.1 YdcF family protein [Chelatococcus sp. SYSU_G07232]